MKISAARLFVLLLLFFGILLHALGSFDIQTGDASLVAHYSMFAADVIAFVGLLMRRQWGYWFAIGLFVYAVGSQSYWTIEAIIKKYDMIVAQGVMAVLCILGLSLLVFCRQKFVPATGSTGQLLA